jgi:hypothetical protein
MVMECGTQYSNTVLPSKVTPFASCTELTRAHNTRYGIHNNTHRYVTNEPISCPLYGNK